MANGDATTEAPGGGGERPRVLTANSESGRSTDPATVNTGESARVESIPDSVGGTSLRRNIGRVAAASAVALALAEFVTFAQTVALARLLTPREVGVFVAGTVLAMFFGNFVEGGLRSGLVHREGPLDDAAETVFYATIIAGGAMCLGALAMAPLIALIFDSRQAGLVAAATAGVLLVHAFTNVPEALLQRQFSVRRRLIVGPAVSITYAVVAIALAAAGWGVWSMVAGLYASSLMWVVTLWLITDWRPGRGHPTVQMWRDLARYGRPLVVGTVGARIQSVVEAVVVGRVLSTAALGRFRYGQRIAVIPVRAIVEVGSISLFPAFSRIGSDNDRMRPAYLRALHWAVIGAAFISGLMVAIGVPVVLVVLGEPWRQAGWVVVTMAGLGLGKALICVSEEAIKGGGRTGLLNWLTATEVVLGIGLLLALIEPWGLIGVGLSISLTALAVGITCVSLAGGRGVLETRSGRRNSAAAALPRRSPARPRRHSSTSSYTLKPARSSSRWCCSPSTSSSSQRSISSRSRLSHPRRWTNSGTSVGN